MNWVAIRRRAYLPLMLAAIAFGVWLAISIDPRWAIAYVVLLLIPGFIGRWLLRDLLQSRALIAEGKFEDGLAAAQAFLAKVKQNPWIKHAIWTQAGLYTLDAEAMGYNNAGAALIELGRTRAAEPMLATAKTLDPRYPIPVFNLAVIASVEDRQADAEALAAEAAALGFLNNDLDRVLAAVGQTYARLASTPPPA